MIGRASGLRSNLPAMLLLAMVVVVFWGELAAAQRGFMLVVILAILLSLRIGRESARRTDRMLGELERALDEVRQLSREQRSASAEDQPSPVSETTKGSGTPLRLSGSSSSSPG